MVLPGKNLERWHEPAQAGIGGEQDLNAGSVLKLLIYKNLICLAPGATRTIRSALPARC